MTAENLWNLFCRTGLPVFYTLFCHTKREEERKEANQEAKSA